MAGVRGRDGVVGGEAGDVDPDEAGADGVCGETEAAGATNGSDAGGRDVPAASGAGSATPDSCAAGVIFFRCDLELLPVSGIASLGAPSPISDCSLLRTGSIVARAYEMGRSDATSGAGIFNIGGRATCITVVSEWRISFPSGRDAKMTPEDFLQSRKCIAV